MSSDADERRDRDDVASERDDVDPDRAWESNDDVARATAASDDEMVYADGTAPDDGWLTGSLAAVLVGAGVLLFLFPEPSTSVLGIVLVVAGVAVWMARALR